jgi:uroporphyrinogen III methyltransferase/synthase
MSARQLAGNLAKLVEHGRAPSTPAALIEWGTLPRQRVVVGTLADLAERAAAENMGPPALLVVGDVVALRERLAWFERRPLHGRRVLVLRARGQQTEFVHELGALGAEPVLVPAIEIVPPDSLASLDEALVRLGAYDWVVFTSANAVAAVFARLDTAGRDARAFGRARVCAIGAETGRALREHGVVPDLVPAESTAEGLVAAFGTEDVEGRRILLPRAAEARETFPETLRLRGAHVDVVAAYRTVRLGAAQLGAAADPLVRGAFDVALFASSSQVQSFCELAGSAAHRLLGRAIVGAIGPVTAAALGRVGVTPQVVPRQQTTSASSSALVAFVESQPKEAR